jgi:hypothetical protein
MAVEQLRDFRSEAVLVAFGNLVADVIKQATVRNRAIHAAKPSEEFVGLRLSHSHLSS